MQFFTSCDNATEPYFRIYTNHFIFLIKLLSIVIFDMKPLF